MPPNCDLDALFGNRNILWCNLAGAYVVGLDVACPVRAVACLDDGQDFDLIEARSGVRFLSHERATGRREVAHDPDTWKLVRLLSDHVRTALTAAPASSWVIASPRPARGLEAIATGAGCAAAVLPSALCHWLNHKGNFFGGRRKLGLPEPAGEWRAAGRLRYSELASRFGRPFVLQAPRGNTGSGTAIIHSTGEMDAAAPRLGDGPVWCSPYLGRLSLNINAMATAQGALVSYPSVQLEGLPFLVKRPGVYCGNDFSATAMLPRGMVEEAQEQTERLGGWLSSLGYRGIFGVDFVVEQDTGRLIAVDLNPRWQGSTALETMASARDGRVPLPVADLAYGCRAMSDGDLTPLADGLRRPFQGSQMLLSALGQEPRLVETPPAPGVYRANEGLEFQREAVELSACLREDELLLSTGVLRPGTTIDPGARPGRIISLRPILDPRTSTLLPWAARAATEFLRLFGLPCPYCDQGGTKPLVRA